MRWRVKFSECQRVRNRRRISVAETFRRPEDENDDTKGQGQLLSTDQVFLTQSNVSDTCTPLNLTVTKTEIEADEEMSVFDEDVSTELVIR